jgi:hypothetical protein
LVLSESLLPVAVVSDPCVFIQPGVAMKVYIAGSAQAAWGRVFSRSPGNPKEVSCHRVRPKHARASLVRTGAQRAFAGMGK